MLLNNDCNVLLLFSNINLRLKYNYITANDSLIYLLIKYFLLRSKHNNLIYGIYEHNWLERLCYYWWVWNAGINYFNIYC